MNIDNNFLNFISRQRGPLAVAATTLLAIVLSICCLKSGTFIVFQNLYYFPIIISCIYYLRRRFAFSVLLAFLYFFFIIAFTRDAIILQQAVIRVLIFILVAGVITFLSLRRKQAEEAVRKSEERYRTLFEESRDAIYTTSQEGEIIDANQSMLNLFSYSRGEMIGFQTREIYVHSEGRLKLNRKIEREEFVRDYEIKLRKKDGTEMECLITAIVRRTADGNIWGYQGIIRDITERKRMEEERDKLIHELQDALANIKTLRGLLPICSYCKKIRDDRGYWNQIESYIHEHSDANFSHGMCPECAKKANKELDDYLEAKEKARKDKA